MSKMTKTICLISILFIIIGSSLYYIGMINGGTFTGISYINNKLIFQYDDYELENKEEIINESFSKIEVDIAMSELKIYAHEGSTKMSTVNTIKDFVEWHVSNDTLYINTNSQKMLNFGTSMSNEIIIYIDKSLIIDSINVKANMSSCFINDMNFETLSGDVSMGNIEMRNVTANYLDMYSSMGDINFEGNVTGDIVAETNMGSIEIQLSNNISEFSFDFKVKMGDIKINDNKYEGNFKTDGGSKKLTLKTSMGSISVESAS